MLIENLEINNKFNTKSEQNSDKTILSSEESGQITFLNKEKIIKQSNKENISKDKNILMKGLLSLARGCTVKESVEEYVLDGDGNLILKSKKIVTKKLAPDLNAIKILTAQKDDNSFENLSDEELKQETKRLLNLLKDEIF